MPVAGTELWGISYWEISFRILLSVVLGGLIGLEREWHNHAAGFRTHMLVCVGSAMIMLLSIYGFGDFANTSIRKDPARLAAQVVSGIGFLGGGAIIRNGSSITGLTTAASIWVVAAIGLCVGAGFYYGAALGTLLVLIILLVLNKLEKYVHNKRNRNEIILKITGTEGSVAQIADLFEKEGIRILDLSLESPEEEEEDGIRTLRIKLGKPQSKALLNVYDKLAALDFVHSLKTNGMLAGKK